MDVRSEELRLSLASLEPAVESLCGESAPREAVRESAQRGYFRPEEEESLRAWFARFLSVREGLWQVIEDGSEPIEGDPRRIETSEHLGCFLFGYAAACLLVRLDFFLVEELASDSLAQRKLNEPSARYRIPRKQFSQVFRSLANPRTAFALYQAMRFVAEEREGMLRRSIDPRQVALVRRLSSLESHLDSSKRGFLRRLMRYRDHSVRRRGASARQKAELRVLESSGRLVAEVRNRWRSFRIDQALRAEISLHLEPGDVLVTRKNQSFSNLVLPGFWPHAALYIGSPEDRRRLGVVVDEERGNRWTGEIRILEALKDGVRFRSLDTTLSVDAVAVIRPLLEPREIAEGLSRAIRHEGKLYNFDFDFFRSDRLVCSEVVYRGFDGVGGVELQLTERSGRPTLSAEDLLDAALEGRFFHPVAVFGAPDCQARLVVGEAAREALAASYRSSEAHSSSTVALSSPTDDKEAAGSEL